MGWIELIYASLLGICLLEYKVKDFRIFLIQFLYTSHYKNVIQDNNCPINVTSLHVGPDTVAPAGPSPYLLCGVVKGHNEYNTKY